jgi:hypothetical protein
VEQREGEHRGHRQPQDDAAVDPEVRGTVDTGGVLELLGDGQEELAQEEDAERVRRPRQDEALVGVEPVQLVQQQEQRHEVDLEGQHQRHEDEHEDDVLAREVEPRERVRGQRVEGQRQHGDPAGEDHRVQEEPREVDRVPRLGVVRAGDRGGEQAGVAADDLAFRLDRVREHPDQREDDDQRRRDGHGERPAHRQDMARPRAGAPARQRRPAARRRLSFSNGQHGG